MEEQERIVRARQVKNLSVHKLLKQRNVVGVGIGYKVRGGVTTDELGLVVSVTRKEDPAALGAADMVPQAVDGVRTDVVETGVLRAFIGPRDRWRPVAPPGVSLGHAHVTAGTFGCLVRRGDALFILSNNHVLANVNQGRPGDAILQPGPSDGGQPGDRIAVLAEFVPLDFGEAPAECSIARLSAQWLNFVAGALGSGHRLQALRQTEGVNRVDAALARPVSPDGVSRDILHIGAPTGVGRAALGMTVQKSGRTTGHTQGIISQIEATVRIDYSGRAALFAGQLVATASGGPLSRPGDSGSAVLDMGNRVVGLLFAGSDVATIINPIDEVLAALNVELA